MSGVGEEKIGGGRGKQRAALSLELKSAIVHVGKVEDYIDLI